MIRWFVGVLVALSLGTALWGEQRELVVYANSEMPPYSYYDRWSPKGSMVDRARDVFENMGMCHVLMIASRPGHGVRSVAIDGYDMFFPLRQEEAPPHLPSVYLGHGLVAIFSPSADYREEFERRWNDAEVE